MSRITEELVALYHVLHIYHGVPSTQIALKYTKKELGIDGTKLSNDDMEQLLEVNTSEEAEYAIKWIKKKYGKR